MKNIDAVLKNDKAMLESLLAETSIKETKMNNTITITKSVEIEVLGGEKVVSYKDAAAIIGCPEQYVRNYTKEGKKGEAPKIRIVGRTNVGSNIFKTMLSYEDVCKVEYTPRDEQAIGHEFGVRMDPEAFWSAVEDLYQIAHEGESRMGTDAKALIDLLNEAEDLTAKRNIYHKASKAKKAQSEAVTKTVNANAEKQGVKISIGVK